MPKLILNKRISIEFNVFVVNICVQHVILQKLYWRLEDNLEFCDFKSNCSLIKKFIRRFTIFIYGHLTRIICKVLVLFVAFTRTKAADSMYFRPNYEKTNGTYSSCTTAPT
jgi:hypothetical protein